MASVLIFVVIGKPSTLASSLFIPLLQPYKLFPEFKQLQHIILSFFVCFDPWIPGVGLHD